MPNGGMGHEMDLEARLGTIQDSVDELATNVAELTRSVNAVEANSKLVLGAVHALRERVGKIEELFSGPDTLPAPRPEAVTQPDLPRPREDS